MLKIFVFSFLSFAALGSTTITANSATGERILTCKSKSCPIPHNAKLRPFHPGPGCGFFPYYRVLSGNRVAVSTVKGCK